MVTTVPFIGSLMFLFIVLQVILAVFLGVLVLLQSSGSDGMGGISSGFAGGNPFMVSRKVSTMLVRFTMFVGIIFVINSIVLGVVESHRAKIISSELSGSAALKVVDNHKEVDNLPAGGDTSAKK